MTVHTRARRRLILLLPPAMFVLCFATSAGAAVVINFEPPAAPPGESVTAKTKGPAMRGISSGRFDLFLAPSQRLADALTGSGRPSHPRLAPIGTLVADEQGVGHIRFSVPNRPAGDYVTVAYCRGCTEGGSTFSAIGTFRILGPGKMPATGSATFLQVSVGGALTAVVIGLCLLLSSTLGKSGDQR